MVETTIDRSSVRWQEVFFQIADITARVLELEPSDVTDTKRFAEDLHADSLDEFELVMEFEEWFTLHICERDAEKMKTVGDAVDFIVTHKK